MPHDNDGFATPNDVVTALQKFLANTGLTPHALATRWRCSASHLTNVLAKRVQPKPAVLAGLGFERLLGAVATTDRPFLFVDVNQNDAPKPVAGQLCLTWPIDHPEQAQRLTRGLRAALHTVIQEKYGTATQAAKAWKCSPSLVSCAVAGSRPPTAAMLGDLGFGKWTGYRRLNPEPIESSNG